MKVAFFTDAFTPQVNGVVTSLLNLAKGLADRGHKIIIIAPKYNNVKEFRYKNVKVIRIASIPSLIYNVRITSVLNPKVINFILKEKPDIIHIEAPFTVGIQGIILSKMFGIPLVGTFHTFVADPHYLKHAKMDYKSVEKSVWTFMRIYYNKCDLITCPSNYTKSELIKHKFKKPIKVISNGIDLRIFKKMNKKTLNAKNNLLFVGRISHDKNIFHLIDAFSLVVKENPKLKLILVGDGPQMSSLKKHISDLKIQKNIIFKGMISHKSLFNSNIFNSSEIFVTSALTENQPITILEAQANRLVCVAPDSKGIPDLIKNNYNGILVKPNDKEDLAKKLLFIINNDVSRLRMRNNTFKEIKKHDIPNIINEWEKTYEEMIKC